MLILLHSNQSQAIRQRRAVLDEMEADAAGDDGEGPPRATGGRGLVGSMKAVKRLCDALDRRVSAILFMIVSVCSI